MLVLKQALPQDMVGIPKGRFLKLIGTAPGPIYDADTAVVQRFMGDIAMHALTRLVLVEKIWKYQGALFCYPEQIPVPAITPGDIQLACLLLINETAIALEQCILL